MRNNFTGKHIVELASSIFYLILIIGIAILVIRNIYILFELNLGIFKSICILLSGYIAIDKTLKLFGIIYKKSKEIE